MPGNGVVDSGVEKESKRQLPSDANTGKTLVPKQPLYDDDYPRTEEKMSPETEALYLSLV